MKNILIPTPTYLENVFRWEDVNDEINENICWNVYVDAYYYNTWWGIYVIAKRHDAWIIRILW